jgi:type II secretory pathway component PulJ
MARGERGVVLLEVLIALTIVGVTGASLVAATAGVLRAEEEAARRERAVVRQEEVLAAISLFTRDELVARLGSRTVGRYRIDIERPRAGLFRIQVTAPDSIGVPPLVTIVHRGGAER